MNYMLADRVQVAEVEGHVYLIDDEMMELEGCSPAQFEALKRLKEGCSVEVLNEVLEPQQLSELLDVLKDLQLLRHNFVNEYVGDLVEKQIYYLDDFSDQPNELQKKLEQAVVAVVGVGGVGSVVLQHLAGAGVKSFVLIDGDCVQRDNHNRQFIYPASSVGQPKVAAAKEYLLSVDSSIEVSVYQLMVDQDDSLKVLDEHQIDLLINAADQPADLYRIINRYCVEHRIPWISAGVGRHSGSWGPLVVPDETICMECFYKREEAQMEELEVEIRKRIRSTIQASFGATNTVISTLMAKDVLLYLALQDKTVAASAGMRCSLNFQSLEFRQEAAGELDEVCSCWKGDKVCEHTE